MEADRVSSNRAEAEGSSKKMKKEAGSESKGTSSSSSTETNKTTSETKGEKDITFIVPQKNERSLNSSERIEELTQEGEGCM